MSAFIVNATRQAATDLPDRAPSEQQLTSLIDSVAYVLEVVSKNMQDSAYFGKLIPLYEGDQPPPPADGRIIDNDVTYRVANYVARRRLLADLPVDLMALVAQAGIDEIKESRRLAGGNDYISRQQDRENIYDDLIRKAHRLWTLAKNMQNEIDLFTLPQTDSRLFINDWSSYEEDAKYEIQLTAASARLTAFYEKRSGALKSFAWIQRAAQMIIIALSALYDDYGVDSSAVKEAEMALNMRPIVVRPSDVKQAVDELDEYIQKLPPPPIAPPPPPLMKAGAPPVVRAVSRPPFVLTPPPPLSPRAEKEKQDKLLAELAEIQRKADEKAAELAEIKRKADEKEKQDKLAADLAEIKRKADDAAEQERLRKLKEAEDERLKNLAEEAAKRAAATVTIQPLPTPPPSGKTSGDLSGDSINEDNY